MPDFLISFSCATFARMYPLSGRRSVPTIDSATWCPTPARASAASRFVPEVSKNLRTAASSNEGELATSTTTWAPASASASPSPVIVLTPESGEAARTSWPLPRRMLTSLEPMRPLPPITTIFMSCSYVAVERWRPHEVLRGAIFIDRQEGLLGDPRGDLDDQ